MQLACKNSGRHAASGLCHSRVWSSVSEVQQRIKDRVVVFEWSADSIIRLPGAGQKAREGEGGRRQGIACFLCRGHAGSLTVGEPSFGLTQSAALGGTGKDDFRSGLSSRKWSAKCKVASPVKASAFVVPFFLVAGAAGGFYLRKRVGAALAVFEEALGSCALCCRLPGTTWSPSAASVESLSLSSLRLPIPRSTTCRSKPAKPETFEARMA